MTSSLPLILRTLGDLDCRHDIRAGGNADEQTFFLRQPPRHRKRVVVGNLHAFDNLRIACAVLQMQILGHKSRARALNLVRAGLERLARQRLGNDR